MAEYRIDQATPGAGTPNLARHDLIAGEVITLTATTPAPGAGVSYAWEIIDKAGSVAVLTAATGTTVDVGGAGDVVQPCSFKVRLTANDNGTITVVERVFGVVTENLGLRIPLFAETSPVGGTLTTNTPDSSVDNAIYADRAGLGVSEQNWRGWAEWAYRLTVLVDAAGLSSLGLFHFNINGPLSALPVLPTDFMDGLQEVAVAGTVAAIALTQEIDGASGTTEVDLYRITAAGVETRINTASSLSLTATGGAKQRIMSTSFNAGADVLAATDRLGIKVVGRQGGLAEDVTVTVIFAGASLVAPPGLPEDDEITQAVNGTVLGTTFVLVGSVYLPAGTIESTTSRFMLGTDQVADTATLELRRFTGGAVLATITATGVLQEAQPVSDIVVADADWYDLYLQADVITTNAIIRGLKLEYAAGQGTRIRQAFDETQTGTTPLLVGSVYLPIGTLQAASRCMLGTGAGGTGTLELRRFTGGAVITTWAGTGALQDTSLSGPITIPASDWYDIYIYGSAGGTVTEVKGLDWTVLI